MASSLTPKRQRLLLRFAPSIYWKLFRKCPSGNHHKISDTWCFCRMGFTWNKGSAVGKVYLSEHYGDGYDGLHNLKTGKTYIIQN